MLIMLIRPHIIPTCFLAFLLVLVLAFHVGLAVLVVLLVLVVLVVLVVVAVVAGVFGVSGFCSWRYCFSCAYYTSFGHWFNVLGTSPINVVCIVVFSVELN